MRYPPNDARAFAKWLNDEGACREAMKWQSGKTLLETWESCERADWLEWLLSSCNYQFTAPAWAEYQRVTATALAEYERVKATAWAEYERVAATEIRRIVGNPFADNS